MYLETVGHGTLASDAFLELVARAGIRRVVDVRTAPGSRRHPWFRREELDRRLPERGVAYRWEPRLGGFRKGPAGSRDTALRHPSFRGYAEHMRTPEFWAALDAVLDEAATGRTAVLCSESLWWRCHRRLIADAATIVRGVEVVHLLHDGRNAPHRATEGVRREGEFLVYDAGQARLT